MAIEVFQEFNSRGELLDHLESTSRAIVEKQIANAGFAEIALSGGNTPKPFLNNIGANWTDLLPKLRIALVDERFVPADDERSNERMIKEALRLAKQPPADLISLAHGEMSLQITASNAEADLLKRFQLPFDILYLGMGLDGHTASLFPDGDNLAMATDPIGKAIYLPMTASNIAEPRISLTLPPIVAAKNLILHIEGIKKRAIFEKAMENGPSDDLPIRHVLRHPDAKLQVYWAP